MGSAKKTSPAASCLAPAVSLAMGWLKIFLSGEIADIPGTLHGLNFLTDNQFFGVLTGSDGTTYAVQAVRSNKDKAPMALAATPTR
jgi:hypothetical protein